MKIISTNPSRNYEVIAEVEATTPAEVVAAVARARQAQPAWAKLSQAERNACVQSLVDLCKPRSDEIAELIAKEMGKPISQAKGHVAETYDYFAAYMEKVDKALAPEVVFENDSEKHVQTRVPLGIVACITPWNFPFQNLPWQAGQVLLAGNAVVYKPSEEIAAFAALLRDLVEESDIPEGVLNVIVGDGLVGEALVTADVDAVLFTGSTKTGQKITELASKKSTRVLTEMGGSAAGIVLQDADVDRVASTIYMMRYDNTGQYCDGLKRLLVHVSKVDEVIAALKKVNEVQVIGDAMDEKTTIGPLVAKRQQDLLELQVEDAVLKGAAIEFGGKRPDGLLGAYYLPTLLTNITPNMRVWSEEVFGPVLPLVTFKTEDEAIKLANDTAYGLGGFVFTEDKQTYLRVAGQLIASPIGHNNALFYSPHTPFGGFKASGNSRTNGIAGFHEVTQIKLISEEK